MTMSEDQLEQEVLGWLADVGWQHRYGPDLAPDGIAPERDNYRQVLLIGRLRQTVAALNPVLYAPLMMAARLAWRCRTRAQVDRALEIVKRPVAVQPLLRRVK